MTTAAALIELRELVLFLLEKNLAIAARYPVVLEKRGGVRIVSPPLPATPIRASIIGAFGTLWEYRSILRSGDYLVVLYEGSILQMQYTFAGDNALMKHRLAYYPCPVELDPSLIDESTDLELAIGLALEDPPIWPSDFSDRMDDTPLRLRAPARFDYDSEEQDDLHSCCHLHISSNMSRIPLFGPMSPGHFVRFVFKHFLHDAWRDHTEIRDWPVKYFDTTITEDERTELYLDSRERLTR